MMLESDVVNNVQRILAALSTVLFSFDLDRPAFNTPLTVDMTMSATMATRPISINTTQKPLHIYGKYSMYLLFM